MLTTSRIPLLIDGLLCDWLLYFLSMCVGASVLKCYYIPKRSINKNTLEGNWGHHKTLVFLKANSVFMVANRGSSSVGNYQKKTRGNSNVLRKQYGCEILRMCGLCGLFNRSCLLVIKYVFFIK